jgi:hypothetical protein
MRLSIVVVLALALFACDTLPARPEAFALAVVAEARHGIVPASMIDDALVNRVRRVQLFKRVPDERMSDAALAELWRTSGSGGDDAATRRRHAAQELTRALGGRCDAVLDGDERNRRLTAIASPMERAPAAAQDEIASLGVTLADSEIVRVTCERGQVAMLLRHVDHWRIVDMYPLGTAAVSIAVDKPR